MYDETMNFAEEFDATEATETETTVPETATAEAAPHETYTLADGSEGSRAAFIREKFLTDNMSRKQIAEQFGFPYRVVYSATVNMTNAAEAPTRGRTAGPASVQLTADGKAVVTKDGKTLVDGVEFEGDVAELGELTSKPRKEWIQEQIAAGKSRSDIAKALDISYGVIYSMTKDSGEGHKRTEVELEDGTKVSRAEYIRTLFAAGKSRGDIAKEMGVPYSVVWQATKTEKSDAEKFGDLVAELKGYADKVNDKDLFGQILDALGTITIPEAKKEAAAEVPAEEVPNVEAPEEFAE